MTKKIFWSMWRRSKAFTLLSFSLINIVFLFLAGCQENEVIDQIEDQQDLLFEYSIQSFNNPSLNKDMYFKFDSTKLTFKYSTQNWINEIERLIPLFTANGTAYLNGKEQQNGLTPVDFTTPDIVYKIVSMNDTYRLYKVSLESPQSTGLPVLRINIDSGDKITSREEYVSATISCWDPNDHNNDFERSAQIRGRGNSTWWFSKKPYRVKFDKKISLYGMKKAKNWVLLANYLDPTLILNTVTLEMARRIGMEYTNHIQHVEVFLNDRYVGNYALTEQIQVKENRVEVEESNGGFLIEFDQNFDADFQFRSAKYQLPIMVKGPKNAETLSTVRLFINQIETVMNNNPLSYEDISKYIDVPSLIDFMLINEIVKNGEVAHPKSVFAYRKNQNEKLKFGPVWDFDWAYSYTGSNFRYFSSHYDLLFSRKTSSSRPGARFFSRFLSNDTFWTLYVARWKEIRPMLADMDAYVLQTGASLYYSSVENIKAWPHKNNNYMENINKLCSFLNDRMAYIDQNLH